METWFIYALLGLVLSGLFTFVQKYGTYNKVSSHSFTAWMMLGQMIMATLVWICTGLGGGSYIMTLCFGVLVGTLYAAVHLLRALSLENIDTAIYFPINKFLGPTLVAIGGVLFLKDTLSVYEYIGVGLGVAVPLLLLDRVESTRQNNLKKGIEFLIIGTIISAVAIFMSRAVVVGDGNLWLYILIQGIVGMIFVYVSAGSQRKSVYTVPIRHKSVALLGGAMNTIGIFCILKSFEEGLISIAYTVNSFYILIPIVLSVFFYKEHMNLRKALAIGLSIVAVIFFQI